MSGKYFKVTQTCNSFAEFLNVTVTADSPRCKQEASGEEGEEGENTVASSVTNS